MAGSPACCALYAPVLMSQARYPSLVAAAVVWTTSITVPQWVFKGNSDLLRSIESRFTEKSCPTKSGGSLPGGLAQGQSQLPRSESPVAFVQRCCREEPYVIETPSTYALSMLLEVSPKALGE